MKILITESQTDDLIKSILKQNDIKVVFGYKNRSYGNPGTVYDSVYVFFNFPNLNSSCNGCLNSLWPIARRESSYLTTAANILLPRQE